MLHGVLFVCQGNICRSPIAETVFRSLLLTRNLAQHLACESRGTASFNIGQAADSRALAAVKKSGYCLDHHIAKQLADDDYQNFSTILAMDRNNFNTVSSWAPAEYSGEIKLLGSFDQTPDPIIEDPFYQSSSSFPVLVQRLKSCCHNLLEYMVTKHRL